MNHEAAAGIWQRAREGDREALDEIFRTLNRGLASPTEDLAALWSSRPRPRNRSHRVGLVGPPAAGKSSLLARLAPAATEGSLVGVVSIDATGSCEEGTRLGDRLRMNELSLDGHVRMRTVDCRPGGPAPGLLASTAADVFESVGCEPIFLESVGLARAQIEIVRRVHTVVLVVPATVEDPVRLVETGLLDLADLVVLNKCDLPGADAVARTLEDALGSRKRAAAVEAPARVHRVQAHRGEGVDALREAIAEHAATLRAGDEFARRCRAQVAEQLRHWFFGILQDRWTHDVGLRSLLDDAAKDVLSGSRDVLETAEEIAEQAVPPRR
jgi:LAO/AO transport system kinase